MIGVGIENGIKPNGFNISQKYTCWILNILIIKNFAFSTFYPLYIKYICIWYIIFAFTSFYSHTLKTKSHFFVVVCTQKKRGEILLSKFGFKNIISQRWCTYICTSPDLVWSQNKNTLSIQNVNFQTLGKYQWNGNLDGILWNALNFRTEMHFGNGNGTSGEGNYKSCETPQMGLLLRSAKAKMRGWDEGERSNQPTTSPRNVFLTIHRKYFICISNRYIF